MSKESDLLDQINELQYKSYETQKPEDSSGYWADIAKLLGGGLGMGVGALLAAPTGGMSLAAGAGLGSVLGSSAGSLLGLPGQQLAAKANTAYAKDLQGEQMGRLKEGGVLQAKLVQLRARKKVMDDMRLQQEQRAQNFFA